MPDPKVYEIPAQAREKPVTCKSCQQENLYWVQSRKGKWILVEPSGICHWEYCGK